MHRVIKFRGQNIKGEWQYGLLCHDKNKDTDYEWFISNSAGKPYAFGVVEDTIGQFWVPSVGLECYGGDLLSAVCSVYADQKPKERICKVLDTDKGFGIHIWYKGAWHAYSSMNFSTAKVIGNIHDNPELLK